MGTAAIRIHSAEEFFNPNVVKVVTDKNGSALYFSRAPIPWDRDGFAKDRSALPKHLGLRHVGIYSYRCAFLKAYPELPKSDLERWESLEQAARTLQRLQDRRGHLRGRNSSRR